MLSARINQLPFWYARYIGEEDIVNERGCRTGEKKIVYSAPIRSAGCISAAGGTAGFNKTKYNKYGETKHFDYVISLKLPEWEIGEAGVVWCDPFHPTWDVEPPVMDADGNFSRPWEYECKRISVSKHTVTLAIRSIHHDE